jgi:hypothetical protein
MYQKEWIMNNFFIYIIYMDLWNRFTSLCSAAQFYFLISIISILVLYAQNYKTPYKYCVGLFKVNSDCHNLVYFMIKLVYVLLWTYILQLLCRKGYSSVSWFLVLLPFIGMFILIGLLLFILLKKQFSGVLNMVKKEEK